MVALSLFKLHHHLTTFCTSEWCWKPFNLSWETVLTMLKLIRMLAVSIGWLNSLLGLICVVCVNHCMGCCHLLCLHCYLPVRGSYSKTKKLHMPYLILCCIYLICNLKRKKCDQCGCIYFISIVTLCIFSLCCSFTKKSQTTAVNLSTWSQAYWVFFVNYLSTNTAHV